MSRKYRFICLIFVILLVVTMTGCSKKNKRSFLDLMPAPEVYSDGTVDPFLYLDENIHVFPDSILYVTDRKPGGKKNRFYSNERGHNLRLGYAVPMLGEGTYSWEEARRISLLKNRSKKYPLKINEVHEIGILDRSLTVFTPPELVPEPPESATRKFTKRINDKLATSRKKDVYIYVHGYKVEFKNPILVASELWHFLGYDGVFIAYAWPSTPKALAYASDLETASLSSFNLRILTELIANETQAENIHIIGYSAGTRVVLGALAQITFIHHGQDRAVIQPQRKIGRVVLVGSDFDRDLFGAYLLEGILNVQKSLSIYISDNDRALGVSKRIFRRKRLGQGGIESLTPELTNYLNNTPELKVIDVTSVEGSTKGNGHAYFRNSPWASSDILMALMYDLQPEERGLVQEPGIPIWTFPEDYIQRLREALTGKL